MTPEVIHLSVLGVGLLLALAYFLPAACNYCGADTPSFSRSLFISLGVSAAAFFTFDGLSYGLVTSTQDTTGVILPAGYSYSRWLTEPPYLKWQVLGLIPVLRYILLTFALCVAAILYVLVLKTPYRLVVIILIIQWTLSLVSVALLTFLFHFTLGLFGTAQPSPEQRAATRPGKIPAAAEQGTPANSPEAKPEEGSWLQQTLSGKNLKLAPALASLHEFTNRITATLEPYLEPIREATQPYTHYLPTVVQEFLDDGGWWLVLLGLAIVALLWVRSLIRRLRRASKSRKKRVRAKHSALREELRFVSDAMTEVGPRQVVVRHRPGRLRLVIVAPSVSYIGDLLPEMADNLLDYVQPGLAEVVDHDQPRVRVWPRHPSEQSFLHNFFKYVEVPEAAGRRSHWVLVGGTLRLGRQRLYLGLAMFADVAGDLREVRVQGENWESVLQVQVSEAV
jgi:hypothetical protein